MPYATQTQIQLAAGGASRLVELADWDGDGVADADVIAQAQSAADGWIDGYARVRFATPISAPSSSLIRVAAEEAVYWLRKQRNMITDDYRLDHEERERWCKDMASGKVRPDEPLPTKSTAVRSAYVSGDERPVSREKLRGFW